MTMSKSGVIWVLTKVKKELEEFYPMDPDGSVPAVYIWARTLPCQNLTCSTEIPLVRQFWLAKNKQVALLPYEKNGRVDLSIVGPDYAPIPNDFDPAKSTVTRAIVTCPLCKSTFSANQTRPLVPRWTSRRTVACSGNTKSKYQRQKISGSH